MEGGVDVREADLIIGTSAGSVVGTHLASGRDPREMLDEMRNEPPAPIGNGAPQMDVAAATAIFQRWASFDAMTDEACTEIGRMAIAANAMPQSQWLEGFARNGWEAWPPTPLLLTAVDCESGVLRLFDATQGVPVHIASAASCSVPGLFPPVTIEGRRYTDGGVRSFTSADAAARIEPDVVLIMAVFGPVDRGVHALAARQLDREVARLEAAGASVRVIKMDQAAIEACGMNLMDASKRAPTADAGEKHALSLAPELRSWWAGTRTESKPNA
jgi:NTE family protein